jgi:hypothetical protein
MRCDAQQLLQWKLEAKRQLHETVQQLTETEQQMVRALQRILNAITVRSVQRLDVKVQ